MSSNGCKDAQFARSATLTLPHGADMPVLSARVPSSMSGDQFGRVAKSAYDVISKLTGHPCMSGRIKCATWSHSTSTRSRKCTLPAATTRKASTWTATPPDAGIRLGAGACVAAALLCRGVEAANDDFAMAYRFVKAHAQRWRIDRDHIAVGGFSAGARSAWNAAYGEAIDAVAVVSLSGSMHPHDLARWLSTGRALPPLLLVRGEKDLDYVCAQIPQAVALCRSAGIDCTEAVVTGGDTSILPLLRPPRRRIVGER